LYYIQIEELGQENKNQMIKQRHANDIIIKKIKTMNFLTKFWLMCIRNGGTTSLFPGLANWLNRGARMSEKMDD